MIKPFDFHLEYTFANNPGAELDRSLSLLLSTRKGTMPLDREFGVTMDFLDLPSGPAKVRYTAEVTAQVAKFVPEVRVDGVTWEPDKDGALFPKVVITNA